MTDQALHLLGWYLAVSIVIPATIRIFDIGRMVGEALEECHVTRTVAADWLGVPEAQLSRAIAGRGPGHLSADRLTRLPRPVWLRLLLKLGEYHGVTDDADTRAAQDARRMTRQARASLAQHDHAGVRTVA